MAAQGVVTDVCVKAALTADKGSDACLLTWTVENFTKMTDNFATLVTSVKVKYSLHQQEQSVSYVVKMSPDPKKIFEGFADTLFKKEVGFYKELSSALSSELKDVGEVGLRVPECFYVSGDSGAEMIFLEDLRPRGFRMGDSKKGLDVGHTKLVLQELARFHAASLLLLAKTSKQDLAVKYDFLKMDWTNFGDNARDFVQRFSSFVMNKNADILRLVGGYKTAEDWLITNSSRGYEMMEDHLNTVMPFDVICHGDCWNNNILFRYSNEGVPVEVMLLDLQVCRRASPALDLNNLLFTSLSGHVRRANTDDFLATYYDTLSRVLESGGAAPPFTLPMLHQEYRNKHEHGLFFGMLSVSTIISEGCGLPVTGDEQQESSEKNFTREMLVNNQQLRPRLLAIFDEMLDAGVIS